jgi:hypothetical protein
MLYSRFGDRNRTWDCVARECRGEDDPSGGDRHIA